MCTNTANVLIFVEIRCKLLYRAIVEVYQQLLKTYFNLRIRFINIVEILPSNIYLQLRENAAEVARCKLTTWSTCEFFINTNPTSRKSAPFHYILLIYNVPTYRIDFFVKIYWILTFCMTKHSSRLAGLWVDIVVIATKLDSI